MAQADASDFVAIPASAAASYSSGIHYLRGLAAFAVLVFHLSSYARMTLGNPSFSGVFDARFGIYGVAIFFAISGYLMAGLIARYDAPTFLLHRVLRIYPLIVLVSMSAAAVFWLAGSHLPLSFGTMLLAPVGVAKYPLGVEWTLIFEMTFYVGLFLVSATGLGRFLPAVAGLWIFLLLLAFETGTGSTPDLVHLWQIPINYASFAFAAGLLITPCLRRFDPRYLLALALGVMLLTGMGLSATRMIAGFSAAVIVASAIAGSDNINLPEPFRVVLEWLGHCSYALYLCHVPTIRLVYYFGKDALPALTLWVIAGCLSLIIATIFGKVDIAIYGHAKRLLRLIGRRTSYVLASVFSLVFVSVSLLA